MDEISNPEKLSEHYQAVRSKTESLCEPLVVEDHITQSMDDVSPPKWHLAHTTWFFETFILIPHNKTYEVYDPLFAYLFNSYYNGVGKQYPRAKRGLLSRPTVEKVYDYRSYVDDALLNFVTHNPKIIDLVELGLHHEQQHQELLLMDIKHNFFMHPQLPVYIKHASEKVNIQIPKLNLIAMEGGLIHLGHNKNSFCYDNELPHHQKHLYPYQIADRLITNGEYLEFMQAGGYDDPEWWLIDGWYEVSKHKWRAPLYWLRQNNDWYEFTLSGIKKLNLNEPVTHISYYEANAYANWRGMRLPTEEEWENFVLTKNFSRNSGTFLESNLYHPKIKSANNTQVFGDVWEWTSSEYQPYPGFKPLKGVVGEYNGKFMNNQKVLRGGSCVTSLSHIRASYRNYFACDKRWQFSGIRLASDK